MVPYSRPIRGDYSRPIRGEKRTLMYDLLPLHSGWSIASKVGRSNLPRTEKIKFKARLHRRFLSQQLDAIFVAATSH